MKTTNKLPYRNLGHYLYRAQNEIEARKLSKREEKKELKLNDVKKARPKTDKSYWHALAIIISCGC